MKATVDWTGVATLVALLTGAIVSAALGQDMLAAALAGAVVGNLTPAAVRRSSSSRTRADDPPPPPAPSEAPPPDEVPTNPGGRP